LGEWVGGRGWDRQVRFHLEMFPGLTCHMNAHDDSDKRVECGGKEQGGTLPAAEWIRWVKVVM